MADLQGDSEPAIDPNTACVACGSQEQLESMLICDSCQQGHHLNCFGLAAIPEEDQWVCTGCTALQHLQPGGSILLESPQILYSDGSDPHLTQGLFHGTIKSLSNIQYDSTCTFRQVQAEMDLAPAPDSLVFYSSSSHKRLTRPPKPSLVMAENLYELSGTEVSSVILSSGRYNMFGCPAAAAGLATEAWCIRAGDAIAKAQQALLQPAKQGFLLQRHKTKAMQSVTVEPAQSVEGAPAQVQAAGVTAAQMQPMGFAPAQVQAAGVTAAQMQPMGFAPAQVQAAGVTAAQMQPMGFAPGQVQAAGVTAAQMQPMGFAPAQVQAAGVTAAQMQPMGFAAAQMQPMQVSANQMQPIGFAAAQMQPMGFAAAQMQPMGFAANQMQSMGFAANQMQSVGFAANQMQPMGFAANQMQPMGVATNQMQTSLASQPVASAAHPMQYNNFAPAMPFFYPPMMPFGWPFAPPNQYGSAPNSVPLSQHPASDQNQGIAVSVADQRISAAVAAKPKQQATAKRVKQKLLVQEAYRCDDDSDAAGTSDDDWVGQQTQVGSANAQQVAKIVYKVLATPRAKGSRMMINPSLAKQKARSVCAVGLPLWRHIIAPGSAAAATSAISRINLSPLQIKQAVAGFCDQETSGKAFTELKENRNLVKHIGTLLQLLSVNDDPLTIEADIVTTRVLSCIQLQGQRKTSLNNVLSHGRSGFRLLFGRSLLPGIDCAPTTVKVGTDTLRIDLHSPLPDGAVTDFGDAMKARGTLKREAQGCIRTLDTTQLHLMYAWHELLMQLSALSKWSGPEFIPARILDQINRWCCVLLAWHLRGLVDNGRPSDVSLYHIGCFNLVLPNQHSTPLAAVVASSMQQQQQHSLDEMLEAFRSAGAVLQIKIPKCKQDQRKRSNNAGSPVDWLELYKPLLDPVLSLYCPTRSIAFSMAVSWYAKGAVTARLLNVRRLGSSKAAPKRHVQPDFQSASGSTCFKALTAGDINSYIPTLYLLQKQQSSSADVDCDSCGGASDSGSSEEDNSNSSRGVIGDSSATPSEASKHSDTAAAAQLQQQYMLAHTKPRKASKAQVVLLKLRQLSGYDQRHSLQKDMLQTGVPLELAAKLASHSVDETKRYAANSCYELNDSTAMPIKLASPEWTSKDLVPLPLKAESSLEGVPVNLDLFRSPTLNMGPSAAVRSVADPKLAEILSSSSMKNSVKMMQGFIDSFSSNPKLNSLLHEPVLGGSTDEPLPVKLLRDIPGIVHLRSGAAVGAFLSRLPAFSASGIAAPAADRLVHTGLAEVYVQLAKNEAALSSQLTHAGSNDRASVQQDAVGHQLVIKHYSQVVFGRLDLAWQQLRNGSIGQ